MGKSVLQKYLLFGKIFAVNVIVIVIIVIIVIVK